MSNFPSLCYYDIKGNFFSKGIQTGGGEDIYKVNINKLFIDDPFNPKENLVFQYSPDGVTCNVDSTFGDFTKLGNIPYLFNQGKLCKIYYNLF